MKFHDLRMGSHNLSEVKEALASSSDNNAANIAKANPSATTPEDLTRIAFETYAGKLKSTADREALRKFMLEQFAAVLNPVAKK